MVALHPTPQGPSLALHPVSQPGAEAIVFPCQQVGWPEAWNERRPPPRLAPSPIAGRRVSARLSGDA